MTPNDFARQIKYTKSAMREVLGAEVKAVRESRGMTQLDASLAIGCNYNALSAAETGCTPISPERIIAILLRLDVEPKRIGELIAYALS